MPGLAMADAAKKPRRVKGGALSRSLGPLIMRDNRSLTERICLLVARLPHD